VDAARQAGVWRRGLGHDRWIWRIVFVRMRDMLEVDISIL